MGFIHDTGREEQALPLEHESAHSPLKSSGLPNV
jgi:hypothetical protein